MPKKKIIIEDLKKGFKEMMEELNYIKAELNKRVDTFSYKSLEFRVEKLEEKLKKYEKLAMKKV